MDWARFDPHLQSIPVLGYSAQNPQDDRQAQWAREREEKGFDSTELWSYDMVFMELVGHFLPQWQGVAQEDAEDLRQLVAFYAAGNNCSMNQKVRAQVWQWRATLHRVLETAILPDGTPAYQPVMRHALPRLEAMLIERKGSHHKPNVVLRKNLKRMIKNLQILRQQHPTLHNRQSAQISTAMALFFRHIDAMWN